MRLAQVLTGSPNSYEYFLTDALGSVRQLVDENGALTRTQAYQPYGESLSSEGSGTSNYGFTGEWTDGSGLQYLRARYYAPGQGRFVSKDAWAGDAMRPMSYNGWAYGFANPVRFTDPSGNIPCEALPPDEQAGCNGSGNGGSGGGSAPPSYPADLPPCTPALLAAGEMCNPDPCDPEPIYDAPLTYTQDKALQVFIQFKKTPGWWNDYGKGELSLRTVLAIMANYEGASLLKTNGKGPKFFAEAFGRTYWTHCPSKCGIVNGVPSLQLLNVLKGSQAWRVRTPNNTLESDYSIRVAYSISHQILDLVGGGATWKSGWYDRNRPAVWANVQGGNPLWFKNWIWYAEIGLNGNPEHIGEDPHEVWFMWGGGADAAKNNLATFYIMSYNQLVEHCTSRGAYSCVTMPSSVTCPDWVPKVYGNYGVKDAKSCRK